MRPDFYEWALGIAAAVATRGDCSRRQVGAVLVRPDWTVASVGYNGVARGMAGCLDGVCPRAQSGVEPGSSYDTGPGQCISLHAELNCLASTRESTEGYTMFITTVPCDGCVRTMRAHRLDMAVWPDGRWKL